MRKRKRERTYVTSNKWVLFATTSTSSLPSCSRSATCPTKTLSFISKLELDRWGVQTFDDVIAIVELLTKYSTQFKDKKSNQGKGERESRNDKDNNGKNWGRKSHLTIKAGKTNRRTRKSHQSLETHALCAVAITGYATVRRRSRLILLRPNSRATLQHPRRNPSLIKLCLGLIFKAILKIKKGSFWQTCRWSRAWG